MFAGRLYQVGVSGSLMLAGLMCAGHVSVTARAATAPQAALVAGATQSSGGETSRAVLWRDPGNLESRDLFLGPGSEGRAPLPPFTFVKEDSSGTKPKIHVLDGRGSAWSVKFDRRSGRGREVPAEIAASRIAWALGYLVEESYLVTDGTIEKLATLSRRSSALDPQGRFRAARFEPRPEQVERLSIRWGIDDNPFAGTKELSGLLILAAALNNWDFRAGNTTVLRVEAGGETEDQYIVSDWGTAFGRMPPRRSRWNLSHYRRAPDFFTIVGDGSVELDLHPEEGDAVRVPIDHARWFSGLAARLTSAQLRRAFEAAGASADEVTGFAEAVVARFSRLREALDRVDAARSR